MIQIGDIWLKATEITHGINQLLTPPSVPGPHEPQGFLSQITIHFPTISLPWPLLGKLPSTLPATSVYQTPIPALLNPSGPLLEKQVGWGLGAGWGVVAAKDLGVTIVLTRSTRGQKRANGPAAILSLAPNPGRKWN